jgi:arylsulfatase A-like enzyme
MRPPLDRPIIVLINCDDLGYGDIGCYGSTRNATPAIDSLARDGMQLTDFYMAAPVCSPSRAAMLTVCYARRIGMDAYGTDHTKLVLFPGNAEGLHPDEIAFATLLRRQGYATKLVGKWHVGDQPDFLPCRHGFDEFYGLPYSNDMGMQIQWPAYPPLPLMDGDGILEQQPDQATLTER